MAVHTNTKAIYTGGGAVGTATCSKYELARISGSADYLQCLCESQWLSTKVPSELLESRFGLIFVSFRCPLALVRDLQRPQVAVAPSNDAAERPTTFSVSIALPSLDRWLAEGYVRGICRECASAPKLKAGIAPLVCILEVAADRGGTSVAQLIDGGRLQNETQQ